MFGEAFYQGVFEDASQMLSGVVRDVGLSDWEDKTEAASVDEKPLEGSIVAERN